MRRWSATCSSCCSRSAPRKPAWRRKLIARSDDLEALAAGVRKNLKILSGWRYEQFGKDALDLVEGRLAFAIENGKLKMSRVVSRRGDRRCVSVGAARSCPARRLLDRAGAPPVHGTGPGHTCNAGGDRALHRPAGTSETGAAIMRATHAAVLRWAPPGVMLTMDFAPTG